MATTLIGEKPEYRILDQQFRNFDQLISNLRTLSIGLEDDVASAAALDASIIADTIRHNYQAYMTTYGPGGSDMAEGIWNFDQSNVSLRRGAVRYKDPIGKKVHYKYHGAPSIYVRWDGKQRFDVKISGKDILYQEFGTGQVGRRDHYPFASAVNRYGIYAAAAWEYEVGEYIIKNGRYKNSSELNVYMPRWYKNMRAAGVISANDSVWKSPFGPTMGNHAGRFIYDTMVEYRSGLERNSSVNAYPRLARRPVYIMVKKRVTRRKK